MSRDIGAVADTIEAYDDHNTVLNESPSTDGYIEIGNDSAIGEPLHTHVLEETGHVMVKAKYCSTLISWPHNSDGYRIWFSPITVEQRERTITEDVFTVDRS